MNLSFATFPMLPCGGLPGCGAPSNVVQDTVIPEVARFALSLVVALAILFAIVGGARFMLSFGRDEESTKAFKTIFWALVSIVLALTSHRLVIIILSESGISGAVRPINLFQAAINGIMIILNATFLIILLLGSMRMVTAHGKEDDISKARKTIIFAVVGAVVINIAPTLTKAVIALLP
jgi:hypothetical protein